MAHLTYAERKRIEEYLLCGKKKRWIARALGKNHSVIVRELARNKGKLPSTSDRAHIAYERRLQGKKETKLEQDPTLKRHVIVRLRKDHSPDAVAGRLKRYEHRLFSGQSVSAETIYQFVYSREGRSLGLPQHWYSGRARRFPWRRKSGRIRIPDRVSVHERPREAERRKIAGHWESDDMIFPERRACLSVEEERKSRYVSLHRTPDKTAEQKIEAIKKTKTSLPTAPFKTMTFDNGTENARHKDLKTLFNIDTTFCDPYAS